MDDEFNVRIVNNGKAHQDLQILKSRSNEILQNEKNGLSTLVTLMGTESIAEFKDYVLNIEQNISDRETQQQAGQQEHEAKLLEKNLEARQNAQDHELNVVDRKGEWDLKAKEISSFSFQQEQDGNSNGIPDQLEIEKLKMQAEVNKQTAQNTSKKIDSDNFNKAESRKLKEKEINQKNR